MHFLATIHMCLAPTLFWARISWQRGVLVLIEQEDAPCHWWVGGCHLPLVNEVSLPQLGELGVSHRQVPISWTSYAYNFWSSCQIFIFSILMESSFQVNSRRAQEHPNRSCINGDMGNLKNALLREYTFISPKAGFGWNLLAKECSPPWWVGGCSLPLVSMGMSPTVGEWGTSPATQRVRAVSLLGSHQLNFKRLYLSTRPSNSDVLYIIGSYFQLDIYSLKFLRFKLYWKNIWVLKFDIDILGKVKWVPH